MSSSRNDDASRPTSDGFSYVLGALIQGLTLGTLLLIAIQQMLSSNVAQIFRYQGF